MNSQPNFMSKEKLIQRVIELHERGLGCRRISTTLQSEGITISKDKAWRMIREHKAKANKKQKLNKAGVSKA